VDEIYCSHYIEHTPDLVSFANELYRIMKVGAKAEIIAPYYSSIRAWQDPTHLRAISEATFLYFNKEWRYINKLDHYPIIVDFDFEYHYIIDPKWRDKDDAELQFAVRHYINVVADIHVKLTKKRSVNDVVLRLLEQATTYWDDGQSNDAISLCREILDIELNLEALLMTGEYHLINKVFEEAIKNFSRAVDLNHESFEAHSGLVRSLRGSGKEIEALKHLEDIRKNNDELAELIESIL